MTEKIIFDSMLLDEKNETKTKKESYLENNNNNDYNDNNPDKRELKILNKISKKSCFFASLSQYIFSEELKHHGH